MKKLYTLLVMALIAIGVSAQVRLGAPVEFKPAPERMPIQKVERVKPATPVSKTQKMLKANAPKKAVTSVDQLVGDYLAVSSVYTVEDGSLVENENFPIYAPAATITKINDTTIGITGLLDWTDKVIEATVNLSDGTFSIADGQVIYVSSENGNILLENLSTAGAPLTGTIDANGIMQFDGDYVWGAVYESGTYEGYLASDIYAETIFVAPNGTMQYTNTDFDSNNDGPAKVLITVNTDDYYAVIYNYANKACPAIVVLEDDNKFYITDDPCIEGDEESGDYSIYGLNASGSSLIDLVGTGTDKKLTFGSNWTFYAPGGYWYGTYKNTTVTITSGTTKFVYPNIADVEAIPADPIVDHYSAYETPKDGKYGMLVFAVPSVDAEDNPIKKSKLYYSVYTKKDGTESIFTLTKSNYKEVTGLKMTEIPYELTGDNILSSGDLRGLLMSIDLSTYDAVGVKSIYKGGGVTNESDIVWLELGSAGITPIVNTDKADGAIYSIDGRRLNEIPAKGLYIQNGKKFVVK